MGVAPVADFGCAADRISANTMREDLLAHTRRQFFGRTAGLTLGNVALASLIQGATGSGAIGLHHKPKAKNVIFLFMAGAPSQLDLFDHKPTLNRLDGQPCPEEFTKGERFAFIKGTPKLLGTPHDFAQHGQSGASVSSLLPYTSKIVDQLTFIKSMNTTQFNHAPAQIFMNTGHQIPGRPSMGSWLTYGLGSENKELPGFVVLLSGKNAPDGGKSCWGSGFLPTRYQGVEFRRQGDPVLFLSNPDGVNAEARRRSLDLIKALNEQRKQQVNDPEIDTRIAQYELSYRMQSSVPELADISKESASTHEAYGTNPGQNTFGNNCLLARRLVERGVRFVQCYHRGWDTHGSSSDVDIVNALAKLCKEVDRAGSALVKDLKERGLLDETIVVWGGEFGRTPMNEARSGSKFLGRDHHPRAFTMWLAGGGFKPGTTIGRTDDIGYNVAEDPVSVHDLHATILHQLGIDHTKLTYKFQGRDFRLTDVHGELIHKIMA
jgi:hypothetical protein